MAITLSKEPNYIYPAFNDSFIEFTSALANHTYAEITVYPAPTFPETFIIYPDANGNYLFNLKEFIKIVINENGFKDSNYFVDAYHASISDIFKQLDIDIEVFNDSTSETISKTYDFYKAVKQVGEKVFNNPAQILSYSRDGVNFYMTYFEGFPFYFDIQKIDNLDEIKVKNINTSVITSAMAATVDGAFRVLVDKGDGDNWTSEIILPLIEGLNRLELYQNDVYKCNLYLKKRKYCKGIYLKWFNPEGGFSHFIFDEFFINNISGKDIDTIQSNDFQNVDELIGFVKSTGKESGKTLTVKAKYDENEFEILKSIFTSPLVQIYTSNLENIQGDFIDVSVSGSMSYNSKKANNQITISVDFPGLITATL